VLGPIVRSYSVALLDRIHEHNEEINVVRYVVHLLLSITCDTCVYKFRLCDVTITLEFEYIQLVQVYSFYLLIPGKYAYKWYGKHVNGMESSSLYIRNT
jgi:hypothetical protein